MTDKRLCTESSLAEILMPTPSGVQKLLAAWDGLSVETQIEALNAFRPKMSGYLARKISEKAFESNNAYIRYLAYRGNYFDHNDPEDFALLQTIQEDQSALVRSVVKETRSSLMLRDFQSHRFWALAHEDRLACVRDLRFGGAEIAMLIKHATDSDTTESLVPIMQVWEVLADYLGNGHFSEVYGPEVTDRIRDGSSAYYTARDLEALWLLIPEIPTVLGYLLVSSLPAKGGMFSEIPNKVLDTINDDLLKTLLYRTDIGAKVLRKKIFLDAEMSDTVVIAALSSNFSLSNEEFLAAERFKNAGKIEKVEQLALNGRGLTMTQYAALGEMAKELDKEYSWSECIYENRRVASAALVGSPRILETILELQMFEVAKSLMQGKPQTDELQIFNSCRSEIGLWSTFLRVEQVYKAERNKNGLRNVLPTVWNEWDVHEQEVLTESIPQRTTSITETDSNLSYLLREIAQLDRKAKQTRSILFVIAAMLCLLIFKLF